MTLNKDIDQVFREGLKDHSEKPPGFLWDNIEQNLNQSRLKRRRNVVYSIAASIALLVSFGAGYMLTNLQEIDMVAMNTSNNVVADDDVVINENATEVVAESEFGETQNIDGKRLKNDQQQNNTKVEFNTESKTETKTVDSDLIENKEQKLINKENKKVKKAKSEGTLLPPMFASGADVSLNKNAEMPISKSEVKESKFEGDELVAINRLKLKNLNVPDIENQKELAYDDRLLFNPYDYAMATPANKKDYSTWSVGVAAAPLVSYRDVVNVSSEAVYAADNSASYSENYNNEKPLTSYSAGVNVNYNVSKRFKIQSGVYYSEMGQVSKDIAIDPAPDFITADEDTYSINTSVGNIAVKSSQNQLYYMAGDQQFNAVETATEPTDRINAIETYNADFVHTYDFYEIPVVANYTLIDRKLAMNVSGGVSANILNTNKTYVQNNSERLELDAKAEGINNFTYSGIVGLGFEYPIIEKLMVNLQPTFRYSLNSINNNGEVYPYSFGIYTGLRYNF